MKILLTNDDGVYAPGIVAMKQPLQQLGEAVVVAPSTEQSGVSQKVTFLSPLTLKQVQIGDFEAWAVDGTPTDCVKIAIGEILDGKRPDAVVSGINYGYNTGCNVFYSGTIGAAIEGVLNEVPSFAVSVQRQKDCDFKKTAELAVPIIRKILDENKGEIFLYNINIPTAALTSKTPQIRIVPMDTHQLWEATFEKRLDPMKRPYYWYVGASGLRQAHTAETELTDVKAVAEGYIAITPLQFDRTDRKQLERMDTWKIF